MLKKTALIFIFLVLAQAYSAINANAEDPPLTGEINGSYLASEEISTSGDCYVGTTLSAQLIAPLVVLNPGFHVAVGRTLAVNGDSDNDGLPDAWEMAKFGNLTQTGTGDFDGDGVTNYWEFALGLNPRVFQLDSDDDGLPDWYEAAEYGSLSHGIDSGTCDCE